MKEELRDIINAASISVSDTEERLLIQSKFKFFNKFNFGVLFFLVGGLFLILVSFLKVNDLLSTILGTILGGIMVVFSLYVIIKQVIDFVEVTNNEIRFRDGFKVKVFLLNSDMKIKLKRETQYVSSQSSFGSYFRNIELYLINDNTEFRIFNFQVDEQYSKEAGMLGIKLTGLIKKRI